MSNDSQIVVPASFVALFVSPGKIKPAIPHQLLVDRHDLCEDLAQMLFEQAKAKQWELGLSQDVVTERMAIGLSQSPELVSEAEAKWVMTRLNELLDLS